MHKHSALHASKRSASPKIFALRGAFLASVGFTSLGLTAGSAHADATDDYVRAAMKARQIPGVSVAVIRDNKVIKESSYGVASVELGVPTTPDTPYMLASMTKVFTASAIMLLEQEGRLKLDEPVTKLLPQLPAKWSAVTIAHCLSHTSGLPDALTDGINISVVSGERDILFQKLALETPKPVGGETSYNQTGYVILGMIIEKLSGLPYERFVEQRLFAAAHLRHASFGDAWSIVPGRGSLYTALDITKDHAKLQVEQGKPVMSGKVMNYGAKYIPDFMAPAGSANGSLHDLINWEKALTEGQLVSPASLQKMSRPFKLNNGKDGDFGLAFRISTVGPYQVVSYGGGAATWRIHIPEKRLTVIVLTNLQGSQPHKMAMDIVGLYEPEIAGLR